MLRAIRLTKVMEVARAAVAVPVRVHVLVPARVVAEPAVVRRRGAMNCLAAIHRVMIAHSGKLWSYDWLRQVMSDYVTFWLDGQSYHNEHAVLS